MLDSTTKQCSKCGERKPLSEFYLRKRKGDSTPNPWCKACQSIMNQKTTASRKGKVRRAATVKSEIRVIDQLKQLGIFATTGKASDYKWTDVVAWGCIPIEVKTATLDKEGQYTFPFSYNQVQRGTQSHFIILVMLPADRPASYHIFPSWHSVFYSEGKLKLRVAYTPGGNALLSDALMNQYEDAWYQIEEKRLEISQRLITGRLILD